jgi:hypothetical protein
MPFLVDPSAWDSLHVEVDTPHRTIPSSTSSHKLEIRSAKLDNQRRELILFICLCQISVALYLPGTVHTEYAESWSNSAHIQLSTAMRRRIQLIVFTEF